MRADEYRRLGEPYFLQARAPDSARLVFLALMLFALTCWVQWLMGV